MSNNGASELWTAPSYSSQPVNGPTLHNSLLRMVGKAGNFQPGEAVFAYFEGRPPWPGWILNPDDQAPSSDPSCINLVQLFTAVAGQYETPVWLPDCHIRCFLLNVQRYLVDTAPFQGQLYDTMRTAVALCSSLCAELHTPEERVLPPFAGLLNSLQQPTTKRPFEASADSTHSLYTGIGIANEGRTFPDPNSINILGQYLVFEPNTPDFCNNSASRTLVDNTSTFIWNQITSSSNNRAVSHSPGPNLEAFLGGYQAVEQSAESVQEYLAVMDSDSSPAPPQPRQRNAWKCETTTSYCEPVQKRWQNRYLTRSGFDFDKPCQRKYVVRNPRKARKSAVSVVIVEKPVASVIVQHQELPQVMAPMSLPPPATTASILLSDKSSLSETSKQPSITPTPVVNPPRLSHLLALISRNGEVVSDAIAMSYLREKVLNEETLAQLCGNSHEIIDGWMREAFNAVRKSDQPCVAIEVAYKFVPQHQQRTPLGQSVSGQGMIETTAIGHLNERSSRQIAPPPWLKLKAFLDVEFYDTTNPFPESVPQHFLLAWNSTVRLDSHFPAWMSPVDRDAIRVSRSEASMSFCEMDHHTVKETQLYSGPVDSQVGFVARGATASHSSNIQTLFSGCVLSIKHLIPWHLYLRLNFESLLSDPRLSVNVMPQNLKDAITERFSNNKAAYTLISHEGIQIRVDRSSFRALNPNVEERASQRKNVNAPAWIIEHFLLAFSDGVWLVMEDAGGLLDLIKFGRNCALRDTVGIAQFFLVKLLFDINRPLPSEDVLERAAGESLAARIALTVIFEGNSERAASARVAWRRVLQRHPELDEMRFNLWRQQKPIS
ncbi:hypothetical protein BV898_16797 [Hypsibius exemplaris]|uniref:PWWP domain-containing protein n=1 Tax=Hypsibius exemplaris TaxID=2072580 RepID=A0A9X6RLZ8_HYPEX|nr:hypothetical protein BV898_16797 [Hypsibius exemplaris]